MLMTQGGTATLKAVISNLFGSRAEKQGMLEIKSAEPDKEVLDLYGLPPLKPDDNRYEQVKISGYVSSCSFGQGRSSTDRQFIFVNGRSVDYAKVSFETI
jgi:DNA mismatch repair protein PMS2